MACQWHLLIKPKATGARNKGFGYFLQTGCSWVIIYVIHRGWETSPPQTNIPPLQAQ